MASPFSFSPEIFTVVVDIILPCFSSSFGCSFSPFCETSTLLSQFELRSRFERPFLL